MELPPSLRPIQPFLKRAQEIEARMPLVAYHCRMYALEKGFGMRDKADNGTMTVLSQLLNKQEQEKAKLSPQDLASAQLQVEDFALQVFTTADDQDRAGTANAATALRFKAACDFFQVCEQFGPLAEDIVEKQKYAKWKAASISKALKAGLAPTPGPADEPTGTGLAAEPPPPAYEEPPAVVVKAAAATPVSVPAKPAAAPPLAAARSVAPTAATCAPSGATELPLERIEAALKFAKYAINSLNFEDVASARDNLKRALLELGE